MLTLLCPKCGKEKKSTDFIENICVECKIKDFKILQNKNKEFPV